MMKEVKRFINNIVLEINKEKPATNKSFEEVQIKLIARIKFRNIFQAINQHAISLLNYHISVHRLEPADFSKLDDSNKIHVRPGCKERLYLPRKELGRDLNSVERAAILNVENNNKTHLSLIKNFLKIKYGLEEELYIARNNELVSVNDSLRWLKKGSLKPRDEAVFCYIQHRNVFWGAEGMSTRCEKMLGYDYTRLYNEVVRCIHLLLLNKYKFKSSKRIRSHSVQEILDNEYAEIRLRKYDLLANDLGLIYKSSVEIIPYVMTWDGIVTKYHKTYVKTLQIPMNIEASIRSILLKKTVQTISFDRRRGLEASLSVILGAAMHKQPTPLLKQVDNEEDEPKTNTNKEFELEEEKEVVEMVEIII
ncbi:hypothetical protein CWI38_0219p0040 [Hamiltosporidium tvaerminnensis]|uniref:Uncharacterized protein n=1 Tax=Hamiltosporidium tvaerminnensis TaxID=1176355 RepID=A0A4V2JY39_9MICR|nr:hypothetical protein CWI38_0219p0040 [Hamiltosporidium tvaerminnensis]